MSSEEKEFEQFAVVLSKLTANKEAFKNVFEALEKKDTKTYQALLKKLGLFRYCRIICRWFCHLHCVRFIRKVCIAPPVDLKGIDDTIKLSEAHAKIMMDKEIRNSLFEAYEKEDVEKFQGILKQVNLYPFCYYICHWLCWYHCHRFCFVVCLPRPVPPIK